MNDLRNLAKLVTLKQSGLVLGEGAEDLRGRKAVDARGDEVGVVLNLIIDDIERKVRFIRIVAGGFLGIGARKSLVPVEAITRFDARRVHIDDARRAVAAGPAYDPEVVEVDERSLERLYHHDHYPPYWQRDHHYPTYPFYV